MKTQTISEDEALFDVGENDQEEKLEAKEKAEEDEQDEAHLEFSEVSQREHLAPSEVSYEDDEQLTKKKN